MRISVQRIKSLLVFFLVIFLIGCGVISKHTDYDFSSGKHALNDGYVLYKFRGSMRSISDRNSISGSPYELFIWISTDNGEFSEAKFSNILLLDSDTNDILFSIDQETVDFTKSLKSGYEASLWVKNIDLIHKDIILKFDVVIMSGQKYMEEKSVSFFVKSTVKERKITIADAFLGV